MAGVPVWDMEGNLPGQARGKILLLLNQIMFFDFKGNHGDRGRLAVNYMGTIQTFKEVRDTIRLDQMVSRVVSIEPIKSLGGIADRLPNWKAHLLNLAGRTALLGFAIKMVMAGKNGPKQALAGTEASYTTACQESQYLLLWDSLILSFG
ncbi:hypothetical protein ACJX0J_034421 [Zea mays]